MERVPVRNKLKLKKRVTNVSNVEDTSPTSVAITNSMDSSIVVSPHYLIYNENLNSLLEEVVATYEWLGQVKNIPELVNGNTLDSKIVSLVERLAPITCESMQKNDIGLTLLHDLVDFKRQHFSLFTDFCDSTTLGDSALLLGRLTDFLDLLLPSYRL